MDIIDYISEAFKWIKQVFKKIINGIINFAKHVVQWFRNLRLKYKRDTPFIANASKMQDMLKDAPVKNVGIFEGVYNEEEDEITYNQYLQADAVDQQTRSILGNEKLVVLN